VTAARAVPPSAPRARTPRAEGERNMVDATVALLRERGPDKVTIRDVATASGHHHRFVQAWFGGKVGLFTAAFDRMTQDVAEALPLPIDSADGFRPETRALATLMNWLVANAPGSLDGPRPTPIIDRLRTMYQDGFGLEPDLARLMAIRFVATSLAAMLFADPLGLSDEDIEDLAAVEIRIAGLLNRRD
jgi:AcrR family transcriptional regulator